MLTCLKTVTFALLLAATNHVLAAEISQQQAADIAQNQFSGRVLSVKLSGQEYRVKLLNRKGQVRVVRVDAKSGRTH